MFASHARNFAAITLVAFVAVILFCTWSVSAMSMDEPMNDCVSQQSEMALCDANPTGHLVWQNFLHITPQKVFDALLAALLLAVGFFVSRSWLSAPPLIFQRLRTKMRERICIIDPIKQALARGIIQPKIYPSYIG